MRRYIVTRKVTGERFRIDAANPKNAVILALALLHDAGAITRDSQAGPMLVHADRWPERN